MIRVIRGPLSAVCRFLCGEILLNHICVYLRDLWARSAAARCSLEAENGLEKRLQGPF